MATVPPDLGVVSGLPSTVAELAPGHLGQHGTVHRALKAVATAWPGLSTLTLGTTSGTAKAGDYRPTVADVLDSTATGRGLLTAPDAPAARAMIGAGTSSLALGTTSTTATPGDAAVRTTGPQSIAGIKTFLSPPVVPAGTDAGHAVNKAQLDAVAATGGGGTGGTGGTGGQAAGATLLRLIAPNGALWDLTVATDGVLETNPAPDEAATGSTSLRLLAPNGGLWEFGVADDGVLTFSALTFTTG